MSFYLNGERRGKALVGELAAMGEVSNPGSYGDQTSLMWVMKDVGDVSFTVARRFWSDKISGEFIPHQLPLPTRYAEVKHLALSSHKPRNAVRRH